MRFNCIVDPKVFSKRPELEQFLNDIITDLEQLSSLFQNNTVANICEKTISPAELLDENGNPCRIFLQQAISS